MYSQSDIEDAVAAGALASDQAQGLRDYVAARNGTPTVDEEYIRVFRGYNDAFVFYACITALVAVGWLGTLIPIEVGRVGTGLGIPELPLFAALFVAGASWGLAEIFTRRRHTALPSILLAITFTFGVLLTGAMLLVPLVGRNVGPEVGGVLLAVCAVLAAGGAWLFWRRFRVPIAPSLAVGMGILALMVLLGGLLARSGAAGTIVPIGIMLAGIGAFVYAMRWDGQDRWRVTHRSDVAFWLHWVAAAAVIYPLMMLLGLNAGVASVGGAILMLVIFLLATLVGLAVNRKIWVAFGIMPLAMAVTNLVQGGRSSRYDDDDGLGEGFGGAYGGDYGGRSYGGEYGRDSANPFNNSDLLTGTMTTLLVISLVMLLLAIFWSPVRRTIVGIFPLGLRSRLPATDDTPRADARPFE